MRTLPFLLMVPLLVPALAAQESATNPPLIPSVAVQDSDSPLVRAAKVAVAGRRGANVTRVIDNAYVASSMGAISIGSGSYSVPPPTQNPDSATTRAREARRGAVGNAVAAERTALQNRIEGLKQESARMHSEEEEPYGGDVSEDRAAQRVQQTQQEMQQTQQQLDHLPPPPPPMQPPGDSN